MSVRFPLAANKWGQQELNAINKVINSGIFIMGENVAEFEKQFAEYVDSKYCVMVNSGSSANLIGFFALKYHSENKDHKNTSETFKTMEKKLFNYIMTPAMILTWLFGLLLVSFWGFSVFLEFWMQLKREIILRFI